MDQNTINELRFEQTAEQRMLIGGDEFLPDSGLGKSHYTFCKYTNKITFWVK